MRTLPVMRQPEPKPKEKERMRVTRRDQIELGDLMVEIETERGMASDFELFKTTNSSAISLQDGEITPEEIGQLIKILNAHANIGMGAE